MPFGGLGETRPTCPFVAAARPSSEKIHFPAGAPRPLAVVPWIITNDASGATDDSADNATDDSTSSDSAVRSNRGIRNSNRDSSQGNNRLAHPRRPQNRHLLLQAVE
jgi:hypothetical protein